MPHNVALPRAAFGWPWPQRHPAPATTATPSTPQQWAQSLGLTSPVSVGPPAPLQQDTLTLSQLSPEQVNRLRAEAYKDKGNQYYLLQRYDQAIAEYLQALYASPNYTDAYYNLGRVYQRIGDAPRAAEAFERLLTLEPTDTEVGVMLAQQYLQQGLLPAAMLRLMAVLRVEPTNDPASRLLQLTQNQVLATQQPALATQLFTAKATQQWQAAKQLTMAFLSQQPPPTREAATMLRKLSGLHYQFTPPTNHSNGGDTMAEYDHEAKPTPTTQGLLRLQPALAYGAPQVLAAYLVHELVHAADGDAISSIREEQDAYRLQVCFWLANKGPVIDTNLDLSANLYADSVDKLDQEVRRSYSANRLLPEKSPGHGLPLTSQGFETYERDRLAVLKSHEMQRIKSLF
jgi:tetratricopeptide (TPR) repeat protein